MWKIMHKRILNLIDLLDKKSFFLFGPRATGKTTLIDATLTNALVVDLLEARTFTSLLKDPGRLEEMIDDPSQIIVIDEVQKLPSLLDEVHRLIQKKRIRFLLTGSSARKLKHGAANLLAGRAREARLFPLTSEEIQSFDLNRLINHGGLPEIYDGNDPDEDLTAYVDTYLREEIKAEAVTRNVAAFSEFLDAVALANGQEVNYERFASDLQVSPSTLKNYFQILEDTLIGFRLPGYTATKKRKSTTRSKFYLFDLGVARHLAKNSRIIEGSKAFGDAFEHFIILEIRAWLSYTRRGEDLRYWRSTSQFEVDALIGEDVAIEIKSSDTPSEKHLRGLRALKEEGIFKRYILVCHERQKRTTEDGIEILPWQQFTRLLWDGKLL
jgi:predicted AAA+ superfamily ATPase